MFTDQQWQAIFEGIIAIGSALGAYIAVRVDISRMKQQHVEHDKAEVRIEDKIDRHVEDYSIHVGHRRGD